MLMKQIQIIWIIFINHQVRMEEAGEDGEIIQKKKKKFLNFK